jgi:hypothetical protein
VVARSRAIVRGVGSARRSTILAAIVVAVRGLLALRGRWRRAAHRGKISAQLAWLVAIRVNLAPLETAGLFSIRTALSGGSKAKTPACSQAPAGGSVIHLCLPLLTAVNQ